MARPQKLTPEVQEQISDLIATGAVQKDAALAAGISESAYYDWLERGRRGETPFSEFLESIKKARASARVEAVRCVRLAWKNDWRSAMTFLERRDPENWARPGPGVRTEKTDEPVEIVVRFAD